MEEEEIFARENAAQLAREAKERETALMKRHDQPSGTGPGHVRDMPHRSARSR